MTQMSVEQFQAKSRGKGSGEGKASKVRLVQKNLFKLPNLMKKETEHNDAGKPVSTLKTPLP